MFNRRYPAARHSGSVRHPRRNIMYHIIVNPASKSGRGRVIWGELEQIFRKEGIPHKVLYSKGVGHVTKVVERLTAPDKEGTDRLPVKLIILGGDGTINEALQGFLRGCLTLPEWRAAGYLLLNIRMAGKAWHPLFLIIHHFSSILSRCKEDFSYISLKNS